MKYILPKGTRIRINGKAVAPKRVKAAHHVVYELQKDMPVEHGVSNYVVGLVVESNGFWSRKQVGATFREEYDEVICHSNREAAALFLNKE